MADEKLYRISIGQDDDCLIMKNMRKEIEVGSPLTSDVLECLSLVLPSCYYIKLDEEKIATMISNIDVYATEDFATKEQRLYKEVYRICHKIYEERKDELSLAAGEDVSFIDYIKTPRVYFYYPKDICK